MHQSIYFFLFFIVFSIVAQEVIKTKSKTEYKIAFGSGNKRNVNDKSKIFYSVAKYQPDVWIWLGDVAHLDEKYLFSWYESESQIEMKKKFISSKQDMGYKHLKNNTNKIIGIWNDHDYGIINGDANYTNKTTTKELFLNFLDEPRNSERRLHHEGIYTSYYLGDKTKVKIILLDVRYNKQDDDVLGEKQWEWLKKQLFESQAVINIFVSGFQLLPDDRLFTSAWDAKSRERFIKLLQITKTKGPIILSGDVYFAEILSLPCSEKTIGSNLYEITSSGLTNSMADDIPFGPYFQTFLFPETYNTHEDRYNKKNFGILEIKWSESIKDSYIHVEIRGDNGIPSLSKMIFLETITHDSKRQKKASQSKDECILEKSPFEREILHIFGRFKQFDFFFLFIISLPFVTVWLIYISFKQFYEIILSCCKDDGSFAKEEEEEQIEKEYEEYEDIEGEEELEEEVEEEEEGEKKEEVKEIVKDEITEKGKKKKKDKSNIKEKEKIEEVKAQENNNKNNKKKSPNKKKEDENQDKISKRNKDNNKEKIILSPKDNNPKKNNKKKDK